MCVGGVCVWGEGERDEYAWERGCVQGSVGGGEG